MIILCSAAWATKVQQLNCNTVLSWNILLVIMKLQHHLFDEKYIKQHPFFMSISVNLLGFSQFGVIML